jgi:hypothetical protein
VPEFIDPVFTKTSPKRSFSLNRKRAFWLVFAKTGSIISGTAEIDKFIVLMILDNLGSLKVSLRYLLIIASITIKVAYDHTRIMYTGCGAHVNFPLLRALLNFFKRRSRP